MEITNSKDLVKLYSSLFTDPQKLIQGQTILEQALNSKPNFLLDSLRLFVHSSEPLLFKKSLGLIFLIQIREIWDLKDLKFLSQKQKKEIRETLLHGILLNAGETKIIEIIALILAEMIQKDGFDMWISPLQEFIIWMNTSELPIIATGLELFFNYILENGFQSHCNHTKSTFSTFSNFCRS